MNHSQPYKLPAYLKALGIQSWERRTAACEEREMPSSLAATAAPVSSSSVASEKPSASASSTLTPSLSADLGNSSLNIAPNAAPITSTETSPTSATTTLSATTTCSTTTTLNTLDWSSLQACVSACTACPLHVSRTQTVFGVGNQQANLMIIGEAPGFHEDQQGQPFVGRAGQLLNAMIKSIGFERDQVYIANILKCRPPNNRDPQAPEVKQCTPFLDRQIALLQPSLLLAVGRIASHYLLQTQASLESLRSKIHYYGENKTPLIVTYHPAYLLRNPIDKKKAYMDLLFAQKTLSS
jgi:uracil-DNA glycosylase family 4